MAYLIFVNQTLLGEKQRRGKFESDLDISDMALESTWKSGTSTGSSWTLFSRLSKTEAEVRIES